MSTRPLNTFGWIAWFALLAALAILSWTAFPQWAPEVPTLALFAAAVSLLVLLARRVARKLLRWMAVTAAVCVGIVGTLLLVFQLAIARVPEQRVQLQEWLSEKTLLSIEFSRLTARLRLYGPELAFADVTVRTPDRTRVLATARGGSVAFDVWHSLRTGRLTAGRFTLDSPQLGLIRTSDGRIQIAGQGVLMEETTPFAIENLPVGSFRVRDALISFQDEATDRGPWSVSGVSFVLTREPELLELSGHASLPTALGGALDFTAHVAGALESPEQVTSRLSAKGAALDLAGWVEFFPERWPKPQSGRGSLALEASFVGHRTQSVSIDARFDDLAMSTPAWQTPIPTAAPLVIGGDARGHDESERHDEAAPASPDADDVGRADVASLLSYDRVRVIGRLERIGDGWSVDVSTLELDAADVPDNRALDWRSRELGFSWSRSDEGAFAVTGKADVLQLQSITPFLAYLPESEALARVRALDLQGTVRDLRLSAEKKSADAPLTYSLAANADAVGFRPVARVPGATGISGVIEANERQGEFRLDTGPLNLSFPWMFRWPLDTNAVRGVIAWRNDDASLRIESEKLEFDANDGKGEARLVIEIPHDGSSPQLDIVANARDLNAASTPKYLPANLLTQEPLAWLDRAFVDGRVPRASLELRGPVRSFPFRNGEGLFLVQGFVENVTFDYQPGWTPATQLTGNIEFRNEGMQASGITAHIGELQVTEASGGFGDFKQGDLKIAAAATGDLGAALRFLQSSPIGDALGKPFQDLRGTGAIQSNVSLLLPIKNIDARRVAVTTKLKDSTVRLVGVSAPLTRLNGSLIVRQQLPVEADLQGEWLGGPVEVTITPDDNTDETATLVARGHATAEKLAEFAPASVQLDGALDWQMTTYLSSRADRGRQIYAIESSMEGLEIRLPYPAGKDAASTRPLRVELEHDDRRLLVRTAFGTLRGLLQFRAEDGQWSFDRGGVRADGVLAALPDHRGLRLEGRIDRLRLDDWFALGERADSAGDARAGPKETKVSDVLRAANLHIELLQLYGFEWSDVRGVLAATDTGWRVDVTGSSAEGRLLIPEDFKGSAPLSVDLERLIVMRSDDRGSTSNDAGAGRDPREWPSLQVHVGDMHVENHPIGGVELTTTRIANGMRIDRLEIVQDAVQAQAHGDWVIGPQGEHSSLVAKITSTDVRATLRALNYTEFLEAERAEVSAQLSWPGGFDGNLVKRASGSITVSADSGQLLMLQPGAGRVLGLFSVAALPRRLALDFSDLTEKGLSFDSIRGDFELKEGNAYTNNLLLRGPAAEIGVAGRTGLGTQDFDQTAVVTGNLGASIPVAGVLAGGPAVGAALLLFSQVFKEPLKGIARGYYRITGTWDNPVVERVDAAEAKAGG
jgi:uncharacterized protein (TIGR02099 family)